MVWNAWVWFWGDLSVIALGMCPVIVVFVIGVEACLNDCGKTLIPSWVIEKSRERAVKNRVRREMKLRRFLREMQAMDDADAEAWRVIRGD